MATQPQTFEILQWNTSGKHKLFHLSCNTFTFPDRKEVLPALYTFPSHLPSRVVTRPLLRPFHRTSDKGSQRISSKEQLLLLKLKTMILFTFKYIFEDLVHFI